MKKFIALLMAIVGLACSGVLAIADSHNWNEGEWIQLPSCSVQGQRKYTCTNPGCDAQYVEQVGMLEHFFLPATCTDKPICQWCKRPKKGSKELGHIKPEAACVEQKCQRVEQRRHSSLPVSLPQRRRHRFRTAGASRSTAHA